MRRLLVLVLLMVVAAGVAAILLRTVARTATTDTLTVPRGVRAVDVATDTGDIRVSGRAGAEARVAARREYSLWGPDVTDRQDGGTLVLRADCPGFGWLTACQVDYDVTVPRTAGVTADADAGTVEVAGVAGPVTATSNAGAVRATSLFFFIDRATTGRSAGCSSSRLRRSCPIPTRSPTRSRRRR